MLILGEIGHNWGWYLMMTQLPRYLKTILNFTTKETAYCSALPFCFYWFWSGVFGHMFDLFLKTEYVSLTTLRKTFCVVGKIEVM
jgi:ACS family sodium-dependent inorganic phosphate cotransporter